MSRDPVIAETRLRHPELVLTPTLQSVPDLTTDLEYQSVAESGAYYLFFSVYAGDFDSFEDAIANDPTVAESVVTVEDDDFRVYRMLLTSTEHLVLPEGETLVTAYERGFFEAPRETSIDELSEALGVSSSAVSGRLRRATRNLVEHTLI